MRPLGREPTICGLIDNRANQYATEPAASMENYKLYKYSFHKKLGLRLATNYS